LVHKVLKEYKEILDLKVRLVQLVLKVNQLIK
jgi:hypothetical protein